MTTTSIQWIIDGLKRSGKTRSGLATALGRHPSMVTDLLNGKRRLLADEIPVVAAHIDSSPTEMLSRAPTHMPEPAHVAHDAHHAREGSPWSVPPDFDWSRAPRDVLAAEVERLFRSGLFTTQLIASFLRVPEAAVWNARGARDAIRSAA